jgi:hypothetical protein
LHAGGVQALAWNPASDSQLISAGFDQVALLHDARTPQQPVSRVASRERAREQSSGSVPSSRIFVDGRGEGPCGNF